MVNMDGSTAIIEQHHRDAMFYLCRALDEDEKCNFPEAIQQYLKALQCLEQGVNYEVQLPNTGLQSSNNDFQRCNDLHLQMVYAMENVRLRLYELEELRENDKLIPTQININTLDINDAPELFCIPGGVKLYEVTDDGRVLTTSHDYPSDQLHVIYFDEYCQTGVFHEGSFILIKVGNWIHPLVAGQSMVLRCVNGLYIFPTLQGGNEGRYGAIGLVLSADLDSSYRDTLESLLQTYAVLKVQTQPTQGEPAIDLSTTVSYKPGTDLPSGHQEHAAAQRISSGIIKGADVVSKGLQMGAAKTSSLIESGASRLQNSLQQSETDATVNPTLRKSLHYTHEASKATVKATGFLVGGLSTLAKKAAKTIAPHVQSCADRVLPASSSADDQSSSKVQRDVVMVAHAGLVGVSTVWNSLEDAGLAIAQSVSSATVSTVQYKYGAEAGKSADRAMGSAVNFGRATLNVKNLGVKMIVKQTAKSTGKEVLQKYVENYHKKDEAAGRSSASGGGGRYSANS